MEDNPVLPQSSSLAVFGQEQAYLFPRTAFLSRKSDILSDYARLYCLEALAFMICPKKNRSDLTQDFGLLRRQI
jgi:hypothetical protein